MDKPVTVEARAERFNKTRGRIYLDSAETEIKKCDCGRSEGDDCPGIGTQVISLTRAHLKYSGGCDPETTGKDEQERVHLWQYETEAEE